MTDIRNLEPKKLWNYFYDITQIPHPSKKEKKIIEFMLEFGKKLNLETIVDAVGNVIIRKPATVEDVCNKLHRDFVRKFRYAKVWGPSVKHDAQRVSLPHQLKDGDILTVVTKA